MQGSIRKLTQNEFLSHTIKNKVINLNLFVVRGHVQEGEGGEYVYLLQRMIFFRRLLYDIFM